MKSKFILLLFCTIAICISAYSQTFITTKKDNKVIFNYLTDSVSKLSNSISPQMLVSPSFYSTHLAFFCRQEIKFEKVTKIPFKFRLGSVQQVDYLEGKGHSRP